MRTLDPRGAALAGSIDLVGGLVSAVDRPASDRTSLEGEVLDLRGTVAIPGLIDCHLHALMGGLALGQLDLSSANSREAFESAVVARLPGLAPDEWLEARGWSERNWPGHQLPDRSWLCACGSRPAVCWRSDLHACVVNDALLELLGAHALPDPPGGRILREENGRPTGILLEAAAWTLVRPRIPAPSLMQRRQALGDAQRLLLSLGVTTIMSMEHAADLAQVITPGRAALAPRMSITLLDREWPLESTEAWRLAHSFTSDDRLSLLGFKAFIDGTLGSRTARLLDDYTDDLGNRGVLVELAQRGLLAQWIATVHAAGLSPSMHAIGDEAFRVALEAIEAVECGAASRAGDRAAEDTANSGQARRAHARIEHAQTIHPEDLPRASGRSLSMQPLHRADDGRYAEQRLGAARMDRFFPFRSLLAAGALLGFGSDWPVVSPDPMLGMWAAITGRTLDGTRVREQERLTPHEALAAYTSGAAALLGLDRASAPRGVLRAGALADIVVLDSDPLDFDWDRSPRPSTPRVLATIVGGRLVWSSGSAAPGFSSAPRPPA